MIETITGIGSRQTPQPILDEMKKIGEWCKDNKVIVRSGHADGADWYFEQGSQELCVAYLPWPGFNSNLVSKAKLIVWDTTGVIGAQAIAATYHPAYDKLSFGVKKLMARNSLQVLGESLWAPSDVVVVWTKDGKASGGSGQAIRIANAFSIPVVNMFFEEFDTDEKVIEKLKGLNKYELVDKE
ncbi:MAG: hypothetical protein WC523_04095 [Patescibacteria group bacterium]